MLSAVFHDLDYLSHLKTLCRTDSHHSDHQGVSNVQIGKENEEMAARYENKSIAEQNSLDICSIYL